MDSPFVTANKKRHCSGILVPSGGSCSVLASEITVHPLIFTWHTVQNGQKFICCHDTLTKMAKADQRTVFTVFTVSIFTVG